MENKKVDFCLTPRVDYSNTKYKHNGNILSTPYSKSGKLPSSSEIGLEDSLLTSNLTVNNTGQSHREKSTLYPQQNVAESSDRIAKEFELLRLMFLNHKCVQLHDETSKKVENKIKASSEILRKKRELIINLDHELETKRLLLEYKTKTDLIVKMLNDVFPIEHLDKLDHQLSRYREILIPFLGAFDISDLKNGHLLNELFRMLNTPEFAKLTQEAKELDKRNKKICLERSKRNEQIHRVNELAKQFLELVDLVKCLDRKKLI